MNDFDPNSSDVRPRRHPKTATDQNQAAVGNGGAPGSPQATTDTTLPFKGWPASFRGKPVPDVSWGLWVVLWFFWTTIVVWLIKISDPSLHSGPPWWIAVSYLLERFMRQRALRFLARFGITRDPHWSAIAAGFVGIVFLINILD